MRIYLAGPLFSLAERTFLDSLAARLRAAGCDCFVPHEQTARLDPLTPESVFGVDFAGLAAAEALVAWLDGPSIDDGTACEIGLFRGLMERDPWRKGVLGLVTDARLERRRPWSAHGGVNLFVAGALGGAAGLCWSVEEALARLAAWRRA
jgi:nucleoside 2-deoxyribosyltransferase